MPARCVVLCVRCPGPLGPRSPVCPPGVLCCVCGVLGHLAPVQRCARSVCCFACAVSWATWLLFTSVPARWVVSCVRCPGPLGSCSPVRPLGVLCCVCGVLGHLAPVHRCARSVCCFACAVSWATWLLFTGVPAWFVVLIVRCPGPLGSRSPVCPLGELCRVCRVLGHLAPVHRCARSVCCVVCTVSWATWLPFTSAPARCVVLCVRCPGPLGSCSPVRPLRVLLCLCGALGHLARVHRCARSVCCVACVVSWVLIPFNLREAAVRDGSHVTGTEAAGSTGIALQGTQGWARNCCNQAGYPGTAKSKSRSDPMFESPISLRTDGTQTRRLREAAGRKFCDEYHYVLMLRKLQ